MNQEQNDEEQLQIISAFIHELIAMRNRFADWIAKYELYGILTKEEVEFLNELSIASQKYLDGKAINKSKETK